MVNFFDQQAVARKRTTLCVALYGVAVVAVTLCVVPVLTLTGVYLSLALEDKNERSRALFDILDGIGHDPIYTFSHGSNLLILISATVATLALIFGASSVRYISLRRGGSAVAEGLGAQRVNPGTADLDERRLLNVVEEMALAASVPVPTVYIMEKEDGINAFAAGHTPSDAVVAVTRGTLQRLSREQLQGVVAHEFSHILNGDMRLNLRLMGLLYGIVCVGLLGQVLLRTGGDRKNPLPYAGILLIIIGAAGVLCARVIKAMISRQREYLADASAVQFTRNPDGVAGALKVIGGSGRQGRLDSGAASECSHMMFVSCVSSWLDGVMATHPPLDARIRRIDPQWDGRFLPGREVEANAFTPARGEYEISELSDPDRLEALRMLRPMGSMHPATGAAPAVQASGRAAMAGVPLVFAAGLSASEVFARIGSARVLLASIPPRLIEASRDTFTARALLLAMLLDADEAIRDIQLSSITGTLGAPTAENTRRLAGDLAKTRASDRGQGARLPLIDLAVASLAALSPAQYQAFRSTVKAVIAADNRVDLFELCLEQILIKHLDRKHGDARPVSVQYYALHRLGPQVGVLLRAVASADAEAPADVNKRNIDAALAELSLPALSDEAEWEAAKVTDALEVLRSVAPRLRAKVLTACATLAGADGRVDPQESELLRAIADTLDLPLAVAAPLPDGR